MTPNSCNHRQIYKLKCPDCSSLFRSLKELSEHQQIKHKPENGCIASYLVKKLLDEHLRNVHNKNKLKCDGCKQEFVHSNSFSGHKNKYVKRNMVMKRINNVMESNLRDCTIKDLFPCRHCGKRFKVDI